MFKAAILLCLMLCGCTQTGGSFVRTDNHPVDSVRLQSAMAQCRGEAAMAITDYGVLGSGSTGGAVGWATGLAERSSKENAIINACMARNGYISQVSQ